MATLEDSLGRGLRVFFAAWSRPRLIREGDSTERVRRQRFFIFGVERDSGRTLGDLR